MQIEKLNEAKNILESALAQSMTVYGVTPSVGRIFSVLYFSKEPMTLNEIKEHVAMSKASISNGVRELLDTEMITKIWIKGERQDHYIAEKDFFRNFIIYFSKMLRQENNLIMKAIENTEPILKDIADNPKEESIKKEVDEDLQLLQHAKLYLDWTIRIATSMETGDIYSTFPKNKGE